MPELFIAQFRIHKTEILTHHLFTPYDFHKLLWKCFPDQPDSQRQFLFRIDTLETETRLLLLAKEAPQILNIGQCDGIKRINPEFAKGDLYWFKLRANPVCRERKSGKLRPLTSNEDLLDYLTRKGMRYGFKLHSEPGFLTHSATFAKSRNLPPITLNIADMEGILSIEDPNSFMEGFQNGIGRGCAFGCGMLLLKEIQM